MSSRTHLHPASQEETSPHSPGLDLSPNALHVLRSRYLRRNAKGVPAESPQALFHRVAKSIAAAEEAFPKGNSACWHDRFYQMLASLEFLPNSPTLMNAGTPLGQLSACFVLPVPDDLEGIFDSLKQMALIQRSGGGTGFSFSRLRPSGDLLESSGGQTSGPISFLKVFDCATENIRHGGRRRGANMGVLRVDHPDIIDFIRAKLDGKALQNFNLSVAVTDEFMRAVVENRRFRLIHPRTNRACGHVDAREIFHQIGAAAWASGDPGLLFLDAINRRNPLIGQPPIQATNPCGEVPLLPYESCNLGSINLSRMLMQTGKAFSVDWVKLRRTVQAALRFLDNVIEVNRFPLPEVAAASLASRKVGLGVMGFAELLLKLGLPYSAPEALTLARQISHFIGREAATASRQLALERGNFPLWSSSIYRLSRTPMRNATRTAVAPTGTIGIIAGTTPGIEPLFGLAYRRSRVLEGKTLLEVNPVFARYLTEHHLELKPLKEQLLRSGTLASLGSIGKNTRQLFATALEISPEHHLQIQAAFQRYVDNSVSKTVNLPHETTIQHVLNVYQRAWELNLKGITVYRYGSRAGQVLELGVGAEPDLLENSAKCDPNECKL